MKKFILIFSILILNQSFSQKLNTLSLDQVFNTVRNYHPLIQLSKINVQKSKADITIAQGAFNPILGTTIASKTVKGTEYYNYINPSITLPTWFGIELTAGTENLSGDRFDPSETLGQSSYIGVSLPVLKNLIIDKKRAFLQQSKIFNSMSKTELTSLYNDILMQTAAQYLDWVNAYETFKITKKNFEINKNRLNWIKKTVAFGERPEIDVIEATTQFQNFESMQNESFYKYQNETIELSAFLWQEDNNPVILSDSILPAETWEVDLDFQKLEFKKNDLIETAKANHPELQIYKQKNEILKINKKLKFQELLPKLDLKYNHLNKGTAPAFIANQFLQDNFQYGVKFEMPLFFSNGRGEYKQAKLKIEENKVAESKKAYEIEIKIKNYFNELELLKKQISLHKEILTNLKKMLKAEETLFENGESSLFLINSRENKVLEAEKKLIDLKTKCIKTIYALQWSSGLLK
jgi:outer membrane protein TolC